MKSQLIFFLMVSAYKTPLIAISILYRLLRKTRYSTRVMRGLKGNLAL